MLIDPGDPDTVAVKMVTYAVKLTPVAAVVFREYTWPPPLGVPAGVLVSQVVAFTTSNSPFEGVNDGVLSVLTSLPDMGDWTK
jgi:hypothetical protein